MFLLIDESCFHLSIFPFPSPIFPFFFFAFFSYFPGVFSMLFTSSSHSLLNLLYFTQCSIFFPISIHLIISFFVYYLFSFYYSILYFLSFSFMLFLLSKWIISANLFMIFLFFFFFTFCCKSHISFHFPIPTFLICYHFYF